MDQRASIGLDNPAFEGRLRQPKSLGFQPARPTVQPPIRPSAKYFNNNLIVANQNNATVPQSVMRPDVPELVQKQPYIPPAEIASQPVENPVHSEPVYAEPEPEAQTVPQLSGKRSRTQVALLTMAAAVFLGGVFATALTIKTNNSVKGQVSALSKQASNSDDPNAPPDETKPGNISGYTVAPDLPKILNIPSLAMTARIKPIGVTSGNVLQAPRNIYDAGWYDASAKPGDAGSNGAILIDGHVHGPTLPGVFANLKTLKTGDTIQVARGDNKIFNYSVVKVQNYDAKTLDMAIALASAQPGVQGLNLITCGGKFDRNTNQYEGRTIVFAVLQS